jgi:hypothetical protein
MQADRYVGVERNGDKNTEVVAVALKRCPSCHFAAANCCPAKGLPVHRIELIGANHHDRVTTV